VCCGPDVCKVTYELGWEYEGERVRREDKRKNVDYGLSVRGMCFLIADLLCGQYRRSGRK